MDDLPFDTVRDAARRCTILIRNEDVHTLKDAMAEERIFHRILGVVQIALSAERSRLQESTRRDAAQGG